MCIFDSASFSFAQSSQGGGHRTLLYGHAILLKHTHSSMVSMFTIKYAAPAARSCPQSPTLCRTVSVPELFDDFTLADGQVGFWRGLTRRLHRWRGTWWHIISHVGQFRFLISEPRPSQGRPAGGPSIQPLNKDLKGRRSGWGMTSFLSVFLQNDTW